MASYVVMQPASQSDAEMRTVIVRDGFAFGAFVIPFFWFLWHRLWLEAAFIVVAALLAALAEAVGIRGLPMILLGLLVNLLAGLEGNDRRIARLRRNGFEEVAVVAAASRHEAEMRYFAGDIDYPGPGSLGSPLTKPSRAPAPLAPHGGGLVGLVGHRGGA